MIYSQSREKKHVSTEKPLISNILFLNWNSDMDKLFAL